MTSSRNPSTNTPRFILDGSILAAQPVKTQRPKILLRSALMAAVVGCGLMGATAQAAALIWTGAGNGTWDTVEANNWSSGGPATYADADTVTFDNTGLSPNNSITITGTVSPASVAFTHTSGTYTFSGGAIGGTASVTQSGVGGTVTFNNANTYSGGTTLTAGRLNINNASAIGSGALTISAGTTIDNSTGSAITLSTNNTQAWNGDFTFAGTQNLNMGTGAVTLSANRTVTVAANTLTVGGLAGGTFTLGKSGTGTLSLSAAGTVGVVTINQGALLVSDAGALGDAASNTIVANNSGAALQFNNVGNIAEPLSLSSTGINTGGALQNVAGTSSTTGLVTITNSATIGVDAGTLSLTGGVNVNGKTLTLVGNGTGSVTATAMTGSGSLTKGIGTGTWTIGVGTALDGTTTVNAGGLTFNGTAVANTVLAVNPGGTFTIDNGATNQANRLGGTKTVTLSGATLNYIANAATSTETTGAWTFNGGLSTVNVTPGGGSTITGTGNLTRVGGASALFSGTGLGTSTNKILFTGTVTQTGGGGAAGLPTISILPWAIVNNGSITGLATYNAALGIRPLAAAEYNSNIMSLASGATNNVAVTNAQVRGTSITVNSLTLNAGGGVTIPNYRDGGGLGRTLTITSGAIVANTGNTGLNGGLLNTGGAYVVHALGNLTISSLFTGGNEFTKDGLGDLTLSATNSNNWGWSGTTYINQGRVILNATYTTYNAANTLPTNRDLVVNNGGTLDLNGRNQLVLTLSNTGATAGSGGTVTSTAPATLYAGGNSATTFAGSITGAVSLYKAGNNELKLSSTNSYTGTTRVGASSLTLIDAGTIGSANPIDINYGTLNLDNTGTLDVTGRLNPSALLTLRGATLAYKGRAATASADAVGGVTIDVGGSTITSTAGGTNANFATLTLASLARTGNATANFTGSNLGVAGNGNSFITIGGQAAGFMGAAYTVNQEWAKYSTTTNSVTPFVAGDYTTGDATLSNVDGLHGKETAAATVSGTIRPLTLNLQSGTAFTLTNTGATINLVNGGLAVNGANHIITGGTITAGGSTPAAASELIVNIGDTGGTARIVNISSLIANNTEGSGSVVSLVKAGSGTLTLNGTVANTYGGATVVNSGALTFGATAVAFVPGALTINGASTVTMTANSQIGSSASNLTINGGGTLGMGAFTNTFNNISFSTRGAQAQTQSRITGSGAITLNGNISAQNLLYAVNGIGGSIGNPIVLSAAPHTITVDAVAGLDPGNTSNYGLDLGGIISGGLAAGSTTLVKDGTGTVRFTAANTFTGNITIQGGILQFSADNQLGGTVSNTITLKNNATLRNTSGFTLGATRIIAIDSTGGTIGTNGGDLTLGAVGQLTGSSALTKVGLNTLNLNAANTGFTGSISILEGTLSLANNAFAWGTPSSVSIASGARLNFSPSSNTDTSQNSQNLSASGRNVTMAVGSTIQWSFDNLNAPGYINYVARSPVTVGSIFSARAFDIPYTYPLAFAGTAVLSASTNNDTTYYRSTMALASSVSTSSTLTFVASDDRGAGVRVEGVISNGGTGGATIAIASGTSYGNPITFNATNTYSGGTIATGDGTLGSGNPLVGAAPQAFGTGAVTAINGGTIRLTNANNLGAGQKVLVTDGGVFGIGANVDLTPAINDASVGFVSIDTIYTGILDFTKLPSAGGFKGLTLMGTTLRNGTAEFLGTLITDNTYGNFSLQGGNANNGANFLFLPTSGSLTDKPDTTPRSLTITDSNNSQGGQVILAVANSYTGGTSITSVGTLVTRVSGAVGSGTVTIADSGIFQTDTVSQSYSNAFSVGNGNIVNATANTGTTLSGPIGFTAASGKTLTLKPTGLLTISGAVTGQGNAIAVNPGNNTGVVVWNPSSISGTGDMTVSTSQLAINATSGTRLLGGNLNINGGQLTLDNVSWATFTGATMRPTYSTTAGTPNSWQLNTAGANSGFAARTAALTINSLPGAFTFDRSFQLGAMGNDGVGILYANAPVTIATGTAISLTTTSRKLTLADTGPGISGAAGTGIVHRINDNIGGVGALVINDNGTRSATTVGEVILAGTNTWTGSYSLTINGNTIITGPGGMAIDQSSAIVTFATPSAIPTGNAGALAYLAAMTRNGTFFSGYMFTGNATPYTLGQSTPSATSGMKFLLGGKGNTEIPSLLGSASGATVLNNSDVAINTDTGLILTQYLLVRDSGGTFTLGTAGTNALLGNASGGNAAAPVRFISTANAGGTAPAATPMTDQSGARTLQSRGIGTTVLANVMYTLKDDTTVSSATWNWQIGSGNNNTFTGAVREMGTTGTLTGFNSLLGQATKMQGGVLEFATGTVGVARIVTLGTGVGQIDMSGTGGGGFAASSGNWSETLTVNAIPGGTAKFGSNNFVANNTTNSPLIFGSTTATGTVTLTNAIDLNGTAQFMATVRGTGTTPEGELSGVVSNGSFSLQNMLTPYGTNLTPGTLLLSNTASTYAGGTNINAGTLATAVTSGTPFGTGLLTVNNTGTLRVGLSTNTSTVVVASASGGLGYTGFARLVLDQGTIASTGSAQLTTTLIQRTGLGGTLVIVPSNITGSDTLGGSEKLLFSSTPTLTNGIIAQPVFRQATPASLTADFVTYGVNGVVTATYGDTNFAAPTNVLVENNTAPAALAAGTTSVFALRNSAAITGAGATLSVGSSLSPNAMIINNGGSIGTTNLTFAAPDATIYSSANATISSGMSGARSTLAISGPGKLTLTGASTNAGILIVNGGNTNPLDLLNTAGTTTTAVDIQADQRFAGLGGTQNAVITNSSGTTRNLTLDSATASFAGQITGNLALVINAGTGRQTLSNPVTSLDSIFTYRNRFNTYTGGTTINGGYLQINSDAQLGGSTFGANVMTDGGVTFAGTGTGTLGATSSFTLSRPIVLNANGILDAQSNNITVAAPITGTGGLILTANSSGNSLTLNYANTYSGGTTINGVTLKFGGVGVAGTGLVTINNGGTLEMNSSTTIAPGAQTPGGLLINAGGQLKLNNDSLPPILNAASTGQVLINISSTILSWNLTTSLGQAFLGTSGNNSFNGVYMAVGSGNTFRLSGGTIVNPILVDQGSAASLLVGSPQPGGGGTVSLQADNTFTGSTTVQAGTLRLASNPLLYNVNFATANTVITVPNTDGLLAGMSVTGTGTQSNTTISSIDTVNKTITLSLATNALGTTITIPSLYGKLSGTSGLTIKGGAALQNGDTTATNNAGINNRIKTSIGLTMGDSTLGGGTFTMAFANIGAVSQSLASLTLNPGISTFNTVNTAAGTATVNIVGAVTRNAGSSLNVAPATNFNVTLSTPPTVTNGTIGGWALYNGAAFASLDGFNNVIALPAGSETTAAGGSDPNLWSSTNNIFATGTPLNLTSAVTINSLRTNMASNATLVNMTGIGSLNIANGGILDMSGNGNGRSINGGTITSGTGELIVTTTGTSQVSIGSQILLGASGVLTVNANLGNTGSVKLTNAGNTIKDVYLNGGTLESQAQGAFGPSSATGTIRLFGGSLTLNTGAQTYAQDLILGRAGTITANDALQELQGNYSTGFNNWSIAGNSGGLLHLNPNTGAGKSISFAPSFAGTTTIFGGGLAVHSMSNILPGNLNLSGGVFVLGDGTATGMPTFAQFTANRTLGYGTSVGQWQISGGGGGFAARGTDVTISGLSVSTFDTNFTLGSAAKNAAGVPFADRSIILAQDTVFSAARTISIGVSGPGANGAAGTGGVQKITANLSGTGAPRFNNSGNPSTSSAGEVVLAGTNNWTGSYSETDGNPEGVFSGPGGIVLGRGAGHPFVRFASQSALPTGDGVSPILYAVDLKGNAPQWTGGFLFTSTPAGSAYKLPDNAKLFIGSTKAGDNPRGGAIGATSADGIAGSATLQKSSIILNFNGGNQNANPTSLLVRDGTFVLGTANTGGSTGPVTFEFSQSGSGQLSLPNNSNGNLSANSTNVFTAVKTGGGTLVLQNVDYLQYGGAAPASDLMNYQIGSGVANGTYEGAIRETGTSGTNSTINNRLILRGGVLELAGDRAFAGWGATTVNQIDGAGTGGGGFAAIGGAWTVSGLGAGWTWDGNNNRLASAAPLILGSTAADNTVRLTENIDLGGSARKINTIRGVGATPEGEISGVISNGSVVIGAMNNLQGNAMPAGTVAFSAVNTYSGGTTINAGTLNVNTDDALGDAAGAVAISNGATLQAAGTVTTTGARTFTVSTASGGKIDTNGQTVTLDTATTVTGTMLVKEGAGTLNLNGTLSNATIKTNGGTTNINSAFTNGIVNANATTNFTVSQTLSALNIGTVPLAGLGAAPAFAGGGSAVVPEPGSMGLLLTGALGLLARRRRAQAML